MKARWYYLPQKKKVDKWHWKLTTQWQKQSFPPMSLLSSAKPTTATRVMNDFEKPPKSEATTCPKLEKGPEWDPAVKGWRMAKQPQELYGLMKLYLEPKKTAGLDPTWWLHCCSSQTPRFEAFETTMEMPKKLSQQDMDKTEKGRQPIIGAPMHRRNANACENAY